MLIIIILINISVILCLFEFAKNLLFPKHLSLIIIQSFLENWLSIKLFKLDYDGNKHSIVRNVIDFKIIFNDFKAALLLKHSVFEYIFT